MSKVLFSTHTHLCNKLRLLRVTFVYSSMRTLTFHSFYTHSSCTMYLRMPTMMEVSSRPFCDSRRRSDSTPVYMCLAWRWRGEYVTDKTGDPQSTPGYPGPPPGSRCQPVTARLRGKHSLWKGLQSQQQRRALPRWSRSSR